MQDTEQQESEKQQICQREIFPSVWAKNKKKMRTITTPLLELVLLLFDLLTVKREGWNALKLWGQIQGYCAYTVYIYVGHSAPIPSQHLCTHPRRKKKIK